MILIGCASSQQIKKATEGVSFETGKDRHVVIEAIIQVLTEEGFTIENINEKYGLISCKPNTILTGELMKKVGEPGGGFVSTNQHLTHTIEFSAVVSQKGLTKLKVVASNVKDENVFSTILQSPNRRRSKAIDVHRTSKLYDFYIKKIKSGLGI